MIDTLMYVKKLEATGVPREQAELQVQIMTDIVDQNYATKQDLKDLGSDMRQEMKDLSSELRQELREIRFEMRTLENRLTVKLGSMMLVGFTALATFIKLF